MKNLLRAGALQLSLVILATLPLTIVTATAADYTEATTGLAFARIPAGSFVMGDLYGTDSYAKPPHQVTIKEFYLGLHEVTFAQFDLFCTETKRACPDDAGWGRDNRPVINVSRDDAIAFATWLSQKSGETFRLPSEAEWEYAARGGKSTPYWWGNLIGRGNANCRDCGSTWDGQQTAPVGSFSANPYGLYDMQGNVYEWVADVWHESYEGAPVDGSAWVSGTSSEFVSRGGSFNEVPSSLSAHARNWSGPAAHRDIGFRLVMEE